jgi:hypothetical protein
MAARKFDSEITVDPHDRWIFRGNEITQSDILKYFRNNLKQNDKGIFIENVFGELSEYGYIQTLGFPCHVLSVREDFGELFFHCDDEKVFKFPDFEIYQTKDGSIMGLLAEDPFIKYRFDWNAAGQLGDLLEEESGKTFLILGEFQMELPIYEGKIEVSLPISYE